MGHPPSKLRLKRVSSSATLRRSAFSGFCVIPFPLEAPFGAVGRPPRGPSPGPLACDEDKVARHGSEPRAKVDFLASEGPKVARKSFFLAQVCASAQKGVRVLGLDPGSRRTGWAVVLHAPGRVACLGSGVLVPPAQAPLPERLAALWRSVRRLVRRWRPAYVHVESVYLPRTHPHAAQTVVLAQARGTLLAAAVAGRNQPDAPPKPQVRDVHPAHVKAQIARNGRATKAHVAARVRVIFPGLPKKLSHDETDAIAIALISPIAVLT